MALDPGTADPLRHPEPVWREPVPVPSLDGWSGTADEVDAFCATVDHRVGMVLVADVVSEPDEATGRAAAIAAARARHPSAAGAGPLAPRPVPERPVLTLVTDRGPRPVPELPVDEPVTAPVDHDQASTAGPFRGAPVHRAPVVGR